MALPFESVNSHYHKPLIFSSSFFVFIPVVLGARCCTPLWCCRAAAPMRASAAARHPHELRYVRPCLGKRGNAMT